MEESKSRISSQLDGVFASGDAAFMTDARDGRTWTHGEFESAALRFASFLSARGVPKVHPRIATVCGNSPELLILFWAILLLNGEVIPVDILKGGEEVGRMLSDSAPDLVVVETEMDLPFPSVCLADVATASCAPLEFAGYGSLDYDRDFLTVFTSGSTGTAKGVVHSFADLFLSAEAFAGKFGFDGTNVFYHNFPMAFMAGILNTFIMPLVSGSRLAVGERQSVMEACGFWRRVGAVGADTFWFNPTFCSLLLKLDRGQDGVEYCRRRRIVACIGTAPLDLRVKLEFERKYGFELFESFGLSETLFISTNTPTVARVEGSVGVLLDGVSVTFGGDGEVLLDAPWIQRRYLQPGMESHRPFHSGDLGELRSGNLFITGRKKDLIIKGGVNVSPRKIEEFLVRHFPDLGDVAVVGCPDPVMGEKTACFFTGTEPVASVGREVNPRLRNELGRDYLIDTFHSVRELPVNANGKIDKCALRKECAE